MEEVKFIMVYSIQLNPKEEVLMIKVVVQKKALLMVEALKKARLKGEDLKKARLKGEDLKIILLMVGVH